MTNEQKPVTRESLSKGIAEAASEKEAGNPARFTSASYLLRHSRFLRTGHDGPDFQSSEASRWLHPLVDYFMPNRDLYFRLFFVPARFPIRN